MFIRKAIGEFHVTSNSAVDSAINEAEVAQRLWAEVPMKERTKVMFNFRNILILALGNRI